ncbi:hypothetical protein FISHEDRAFT_56631 [Fistulina hepatica ATCC 64428]|uniref:Uncharacterized protein n=1 Tax=Fistulina hepatica ATCC 64428 TaxID=1128425 RepID=A0A0D7AIB3_9AGAR|nr:hypothetical protein FISHEDRAFT_56631 [Fistulina hepatica ATCC 64428]
MVRTFYAFVLLFLALQTTAVPVDRRAVGMQPLEARHNLAPGRVGDTVLRRDENLQSRDGKWLCKAAKEDSENSESVTVAGSTSVIYSSVRTRAAPVFAKEMCQHGQAPIEKALFSGASAGPPAQNTRASFFTINRKDDMHCKTVSRHHDIAAEANLKGAGPRIEAACSPHRDTLGMKHSLAVWKRRRYRTAVKSELYKQLRGDLVGSCQTERTKERTSMSYCDLPGWTSDDDST